MRFKEWLRKIPLVGISVIVLCSCIIEAAPLHAAENLEKNRFLNYEGGFGSGAGVPDPSSRTINAGLKYGSFIFPFFLWWELGGTLEYETMEQRIDRMTIKPEVTLAAGLGIFVSMRGGFYTPVGATFAGFGYAGIAGRYSACVLGICVYFAREVYANSDISNNDKAGLYLSIPSCWDRKNCMGGL